MGANHQEPCDLKVIITVQEKAKDEQVPN
jgi:hypothetical protein